jgi:UDP-glucose 4-epimerase
MKHVIIGGAGFIGHHLVKELLSQNKQVIVIDDLSTGNINNLDLEKIEFVKLDISKDTIDHLISDGDVVFHLAAKARVQPSINHPSEFDLVNVHGLVKVLESCKNKKIKKFIFSSSSSVYGDTEVLPTNELVSTNPMSPYALQKLIGEQYCFLFKKLYDLDTVILRYFNVYGENMPLEGAYRTLISIFGNQYKKNEPFTVTNDGNQKRDFTYVKDVVNANILASKISDQQNCEIYNVGNGKSYSVNDVVKLFGANDIINIGPKVEPFATLCDNKKIKSDLNWSPSGNLELWIQEYKKKLRTGE